MASDWPRKVRLLNETPNREVEVDQAEYTDLLRLGYIKEGGSKVDTARKED